MPRARCIYSAVAQAAAGFACACAYACLSFPLPNAALRRPLARVHTRVYVYILRARGPQYNRAWLYHVLKREGSLSLVHGLVFLAGGALSRARGVPVCVFSLDMRMCVMWLWAEELCGDVLHAG